jgi:competence protein ComEC
MFSLPPPDIFMSVIDQYLPQPHAELLNGIIFGRPINASGQFYRDIQRVGLMHIVVLSGTNITILSAIIASALSSFPKKLAVFITICCILIFVMFVRPQAPIVRAAIMGIISLIGILWERSPLPLYLLLLSAVLTAIFAPVWISTISFQLSYAATLGIIVCGTKPSRSTKIPFWAEIKPSIAAHLFTVPITFYYFKSISFIAPLSNLCVDFLIAPLMVFGFITAILGRFSLELGEIPAYVCYCILTYLVTVIRVLSILPFAYMKLT